MKPPCVRAPSGPYSSSAIRGDAGRHPSITSSCRDGPPPPGAPELLLNTESDAIKIYKSSSPPAARLVACFHAPVELTERTHTHPRTANVCVCVCVRVCVCSAKAHTSGWCLYCELRQRTITPPSRYAEDICLCVQIIIAASKMRQTNSCMCCSGRGGGPSQLNTRRTVRVPEATQNTHTPSVFTKTAPSYPGCLVNGSRERQAWRHAVMPSASARH